MFSRLIRWISYSGFVQPAPGLFKIVHFYLSSESTRFRSKKVKDRPSEAIFGKKEVAGRYYFLDRRIGSLVITCGH